MTIWQPGDIARFAYNAGWSGSDLITAIAICLAESSGDDHATNANLDGSLDRGLWQINNRYHSEVSDTTAFNPQGNADAAHEISLLRNNTVSFQPWSTYTGGTYQQYVDVATAAASLYVGPSPPPRTPSQTTAVRSDNKVLPVDLSGPVGTLPLLITDAPITDSPNQTITNGDPGGPKGISSTVVVPNGYGTAKYRRGLSFIYGRRNFARAASQAMQIHPPANLEGYRRGWASLPNMGQNPGNPTDGNTITGMAAAQVQGEWMYYFCTGRTGFSDTILIFKNNQADFSLSVYSRSYVLTFGQISLFQAVSDAFIADTSPVQVFVKCTVSGSTPTEIAWFVDNRLDLGDRFDSMPFVNADNGVSTPGTGIHITGKFGQGLQRYESPAGVTSHPHGANLVHPWSAGDYGAPQLWWWVAEKKNGSFTGRFKIYYSKFYKNMWQPMNPGHPFPHDARDVLHNPNASHSEGAVGIDVQPDATGNNNPHGNAFERKFHYLGTVGPFPDMSTVDVGGWPSIKVLRSRRKRNRLYFVAMGTSKSMAASASASFSGRADFFNGGWYAISEDDGKHWGAPKQMVRANQHLDGFVDYNPVVTNEDIILANIHYSDSRTDQIGHGFSSFNPALNNSNAQYETGVERAAYVVLNYDPHGVGNTPDRQQQVFKQGEKVSDSWL